MFWKKKLNYGFKLLSQDGLCFALCLSVFVAKIYKINKNKSTNFQQTQKKTKKYLLDLSLLPLQVVGISCVTYFVS